ncbi:MAG: hypothetical protein CM15mP49_05540 [Actinomycetota bacterium]|nr:MAG: hypothetical protein CM15mP49_05540 [Actinomycetota bacterium]
MLGLRSCFADQTNGKTGLITNGLESVQKARLRHFNLYQYFDAILISGECGLAKPNPAIFQSSLDLLNHEHVDSVLMIGDSLSSDIAGANIWHRFMLV